MRDVLLKGGRVVDPAAGRDEVADVLLRASRVAGIAPEISSDDADVVDCRGLVVAPGFVDLHTHLREPGREDAETVETGSRAAALGGYTAVCAMANTDPVADNAGIVEQVAAFGRRAGLVDVYPVGAITVGLKGERLAEMGEMATSSARVRFFSDDGRCVQNAALMRRAMEYARTFDAIIANHAEEGDLAAGGQMNEGDVSSILGLPGIPAEAEELIVARDLALARLTGARLHVPHVSTAGTVALIRAAKAAGASISAEVTPHHLCLTEDLIRTYDPVYKVAPPLRTKADVEALRDALLDGTIDCVATDHAPHTQDDKEREWDAAPCGMVGLETALGVVCAEAGLDLTRLVERMSTAPARIRGLSGHGGPLNEGAPANITVFDPEAAWTIDAATMATRSRNTPFVGRELKGKVHHTIYGGRFTVREGRITNGQG
ncbi:MAG: dihydroorotase [Actinomycetota bacterium]|nr:dihydroorotase [Actinomycetota bacterium]